jgi:hypothetical protein
VGRMGVITRRQRCAVLIHQAIVIRGLTALKAGVVQQGLSPAGHPNAMTRRQRSVAPEEEPALKLRLAAAKSAANPSPRVAAMVSAPQRRQSPSHKQPERQPR